MEAVVLGAVVGLVAGLVPGAYFTLVATTALEGGARRGVAVAVLPLAIEIPILLTTVLVLTQLPSEWLRWVGTIGGALLVFMAWKLVRDARYADPDSRSERFGGQLLRVALVGTMSPDPWIFWFLLGGPLFLNRWYVDPLQGVAFVAVFLAFLVGTRTAVALAVGHSRTYFDVTWYRRALRGAAGLLAMLGALIVWQSLVGNFEALVESPERIEKEVLGGGTGEIGHPRRLATRAAGPEVRAMSPRTRRPGGSSP